MVAEIHVPALELLDQVLRVFWGFSAKTETLRPQYREKCPYVLHLFCCLTNRRARWSVRLLFYFEKNKICKDNPGFWCFHNVAPYVGIVQTIFWPIWAYQYFWPFFVIFTIRPLTLNTQNIVRSWIQVTFDSKIRFYIEFCVEIVGLISLAFYIHPLRVDKEINVSPNNPECG